MRLFYDPCLCQTKTHKRQLWLKRKISTKTRQRRSLHILASELKLVGIFFLSKAYTKLCFCVFIGPLYVMNCFICVFIGDDFFHDEL